MSFKKLVHLVSTSPRPLMLHFLHATVEMTSQPLQAAAESAAVPGARNSFGSELGSDLGDVGEDAQFVNV